LNKFKAINLNFKNKLHPHKHHLLINSSFTDYSEERNSPNLKSLFLFIKGVLIRKFLYTFSEKKIRKILPSIAKSQDLARRNGGLTGTYQWVRLNEIRYLLKNFKVNSVCEFGSGGSTAIWNELIKGKVFSIEESEFWIQRTREILPKDSKVDLIFAERIVVEYDSEPATRYKLDDDFYKQNFDLIYIDGPTARPLNNSERKLKILDRKKKMMPNIDIELFIKNGNPPKYILIDGRGSTVRRLCKYYADIYDIYLRYYYQPKWDKSGTFLYHTLLIRRS